MFGQGKYGVRIQVDPDALATHAASASTTLATAVASANVNQSTGSLNGVRQAASILATGQLNDATDFRNPDHRLSQQRAGPAGYDIATVVDGQEKRIGRHLCMAGRHRAGNQPPARLQHGRGDPGKSRPSCRSFEAGLPKGVELLKVLYDQSDVINAEVNDVQYTLLIAGMFVVGVIFVFLRRLSATLIPSLALPIAVIATFAGTAMRFSSPSTIFR